MARWIKGIAEGVLYFWLSRLVVNNGHVRFLLRRMLFSTLLFGLAIELSLVAFLIFIGSLFFFLSNQTGYIMPAFWIGLIVFMLSILSMLWSSYFWRIKS